MSDPHKQSTAYKSFYTFRAEKRGNVNLNMFPIIVSQVDM